MARIRTIKPEFFLHEDLYDLEKTTGFPIRVAFAGLWTQSDREGRFKWKIRSLKVAILPHDELDFSRVLDALWSRGFIEKYRAENGEELGYIPSFPDHQSINFKESPSVLPNPTPERVVARTNRDSHARPTREPRVHDGKEGKEGKEGKGKEGKGRKEGGAPAAPPPSPPVSRVKKTKENFAAPTQGEIRDYFLKLMKEKWGEVKCFNEADSCLDHYGMNGWVQNKGKPVVDWKAAARQWIRRAIDGDFSPPARAASRPSTAPVPTGPPPLSKTQQELNFLYSRWLEDPAMVTVISIQGEHYNCLKAAGSINFSTDKVEQIRKIARQHMADLKLEGLDKETGLMKKFGVLELFKTLKENGATQVYTP